MKKIIRIFSKSANTTPDTRHQGASRDVQKNMSQVIQRVDKQIGHAVTRLSER